MLCVKFNNLTRECTPSSGGVSRLLIFDPSDFDWTQDPYTKAYTAVARREGADAANPGNDPNLSGFFFDIKFKRKEAEFKFTHSIGASGAPKYASELTALYAALGQELTNFLINMDAASYCCGIGLAVILNSGVIYILGEGFVNGDFVDPYYEVLHNGTEATSGKLFDDLNGATLKFTSDYGRPPHTFAGGLNALLSMMYIPTAAETTVESVKVIPDDKPETAKETELQFNSIVFPLTAPQSVTWTVELAAGGPATGVTIDQLGKVTIGAGASETDYKVTATSVADNGKSDSAEFTVTGA